MDFIPTFFNIGYCKYMPGTIGSLFAMVSGILIINFSTKFYLFIALAVLGILAVSSIPELLKKLKTPDPACIVVDEVIGQWLVLLLIPNINFFYSSLGFIFFRIFDILKPWPINLIDNASKIGSLKKQALLIICDDVVAGVFAVISIWLIYFTLIQ